MDIDIYQPCPCNSGKKIKFCCAKDITADLNQILAKSAAKQSAAAIDLIDRVVERVGDRDCLSIIKTHILLSVDELDKAKETNDAFLATVSKHPIGLQHRALIKAGEGDVAGAVKSLQKAMNAISGNEIPISFANAFRIVGTSLLSIGHLLAARAHFNYSLMLKDSDEQTQGLLIQTYRMPDISMLLKHDLRLDPVPEDESLPWRKHYVNVMRALDRGQFLFALKILKKANEESPNVPEIVRGIAILTSDLALEEEMASTWREYSQMPGIARWDAVEAEALAQMLGNAPLCEHLDFVAVTYELSDMERASEAAIASPRLISHEVPPQTEESHGPPPRFIYMVLDRDEVKESEGLKLEDVPNAVGELLMFGRQTDRKARIEFVAVKNEQFEATSQFIQETFGTELEGEPIEETVGQTSVLENTLTWNWHLPRDVTREQYDALSHEMRKQVMLDRWPTVPFTLFDGQTALEACKDEKNSIALESLMIQLQASSDQQATETSLVDELRERLGLPIPEMIDPESIGNRLVSPIRQKYLIIDKLSDEQIVGLQSEAMTIGNMGVLRLIMPEILSRPSTDEMIPHDICHSVMAQLVEDDEESFLHLQKARSTAKKNNRPFGVYLVQELELSILKGKKDKIPVLLREIETNHMTEPNVEYQLVRVLQRFGLITQDGRMAMGRPSGPEAGPAEPAGIWTPEGGGSEAAEEPEESGESKLWIPGQ